MQYSCIDFCSGVKESQGAICRDVGSVNAPLLLCFSRGLGEERCGGSCGVVHRVFDFLFAAEQYYSYCELEDEKGCDSRGITLMRSGTLTLIEAQCVQPETR